MQLDANLYITFKSVIGRQFIKSSLDLSPFGMHIIRPSLCVTVSPIICILRLFPFFKYVNIFIKEIENSTENPSDFYYYSFIENNQTHYLSLHLISHEQTK